MPSIISVIFAFTLSLDDLVVASFTTGPGANTLPIVFFSKVRLGLSPEVNALSSIIMLFVVIAAIIFILLIDQTFKSKYSRSQAVIILL